MKKYLMLLVVFLMVFVLGNGIAQAEDVNDDSSDDSVKIEQENLRKEWETKREEAKKEMELKREEAKKKMEVLRDKIKDEKDIVKAKIKETIIVGREKALERFDAAVLRMSNLKDKVNAQITKLETRGVDVKNAESFVVIAETKIDSTKAKITEANTLLATSINELTLANKTKLRTLTQEIQTLIKETQSAFKDSVKALREAVKIKMDADKNTQEDQEDTDEDNDQ